MRPPTLLGLILTIGVHVSSGAVAQQPGRANIRALFLELDANSDQVVSLSEVPESAIPAFRKLLRMADRNRDENLEFAELRTLMESIGFDPASGGLRALDRLKQMDRDGDGKVSRAEFAGPPQLFGRLDADADGFVTSEEAGRMARPGQPPAPASGAGPESGAKEPAQDPLPARPRGADKDGDGKVSREEFRGPAPLFLRLDRDGDGFLSPEESGRPGAARGPRGKTDGPRSPSPENRPAPANPAPANPETHSGN